MPPGARPGRRAGDLFGITALWHHAGMRRLRLVVLVLSPILLVILAWLARPPPAPPLSPAPPPARPLASRPAPPATGLPDAPERSGVPPDAPYEGPVAEEANRRLTEALGMTFVVCPQPEGWKITSIGELPSGFSADTFWFAAPEPSGASCRARDRMGGVPDRVFRWHPTEDGSITCVAEPAWTTTGEVRVVDGDGRPIEGAFVAASQGDLVANAVTDASGVAEVELCADQPAEVDVRIGVETPGHSELRPLGSVVVRPHERVDLVAAEGRTWQDDLALDREALLLATGEQLDALRELLADPDLPGPVADVLRAKLAGREWLFEQRSAWFDADGRPLPIVVERLPR
jgi:hypothetical protein